MARPALIGCAGVSVTVHAKTHLEPGFMNPSIRRRELFVASRTGDARMFCVAEKDVRRDSVNLNPLNSRRETLILVAIFTLVGYRNCIGSEMAF
jgi:hypothetical protein